MDRSQVIHRVRRLPAKARQKVVKGVTKGVFVDRGPSCPISWKPSVFAPVFYGYTDTTAILPMVATQADAGASAKLRARLRPELGVGTGGILALGEPVRIFFPSLDGSPQHAPILKGCGRYPLVIFAHGQCVRDEEPYKEWFELPATLARCGYVVIVPDLDLGAPSGNEAEQRLIGQLSSWARTRWEHKDVVMPAPATALVGHSWGGGLLGHVAGDSPGQYAAYVSLSGVEVPGSVGNAAIPKLMTWGDDFALEVPGVQISQWDRLRAPIHVAEFHQAGHWDYLPAGRSACDVDQNGQPARGTCTLTPFLAADIVSCFLTRYLRPEGVGTGGWLNPFRISKSLKPPLFSQIFLTNEQRFFAGGHLMSWGAVESREACGVTLRWKIGGETDELVHG